MGCIKTGADVWFSNYGVLIHGDLFEQRDVIILNVAGPASDYFNPKNVAVYAHASLRSNPKSLVFYKGEEGYPIDTLNRGAIIIYPRDQMDWFEYDARRV